MITTPLLHRSTEFKAASPTPYSVPQYCSYYLLLQQRSVGVAFVEIRVELEVAMFLGLTGWLVIAGLLADVSSSANSFDSPHLHKVVSIRVSSENEAPSSADALAGRQ